MKKRDIIFVSIIVILLVIIFGLILCYNNQKDNPTEKSTIIAEVLAIGTDYLLVTTEEEIDYVIKTKDLKYKIGDKLKFELINIYKEKSPIEATANNITLVNEVETNTNKVEDDQDEKIIAPKEEIQNNNISQNEISSSPVENTEEEIINYFNDFNIELTNYKQDTNLENEIKLKFVKCIDFIFYEGTIGNKKFDDLTNETKIKILELAFIIDSKIDKILPDYKENISTTYQKIKTKLIEKYLEITTMICKSNEELCDNAKEIFKEIKNTFEISWDTIKELTEKSALKIKDWYEIWKYE